ncbi:MAG TPA: hypothetical protein VKZ50_18855 [bacterium]|nr:hypothetical protein [bacterium]
MPVPFFLALNLAECAIFLAAYLYMRVYRPRDVRWTAAVVALAAATYLATFVAMLVAGARAR